MNWYKDRCLEYFFLFSTKNLELVSNMFADNIHLHDWEHNTSNKEETVAVYKKIFDSVNTIAVTPFAMYCEGTTVIAELWITINTDLGNEQIYVTDVITFDKHTDEIISVRAYKG